jgi:hypothetical protein
MPAYWHGGIDGLKVGEYILPPSVTEAERREHVHDRDRVFVAESRHLALMYAVRHEMPGAIYRALPVGERRPGPWYDGPGVWTCDRALILAVHDLPPEAKRLVMDLFYQFHRRRDYRQILATVRRNDHD